MRIVNTVMQALQQILHQIDDRVLMEQLVRQVLGQARSRKDLRLRVAAEDFDRVNQWLPTVLKDYSEVDFVDVLKDPAAPAGTCVLESELGAIDASVDVQLAAIRRGLVNAFIEKRVVHAAARDTQS
jgi:type III secretion protein L